MRNALRTPREPRAHIAALFVLATALTLLPACPGGGGGGLFGDDIAFADMFNATGSVNAVPVRGRLVEEDDLEEANDPDTTPLDQISQDELKNVTVTLALNVNGDSIQIGTATTDDEGYLDALIDVSDLDLDPGRYELEVIYDDEPVGDALVTLLAADHDQPIVRSDVDLTYLNTDFMSSAGLAGLVVDDASKRDALPAMETLYQRLRGDQGRPVTFLSGSPRFFKRTLESKMRLDRVEQDGLVLKPFKDIVTTNINDLDFDEIVPELKEQIGYKLFWLLRLRAELPPTTPELLMGDDSEADVVVYALYHRLLSGQLDPDAFMDQLDQLDVAASWQADIARVLPNVSVEPSGQVAAIYINRTGVGGEHYPVSDWSEDGLVRYHTGAWPLALDLYEEGHLSQQDADAVRQRLLTLGQTQDQLDAAALDADFLDPDTFEDF